MKNVLSQFRILYWPGLIGILVISLCATSTEATLREVNESIDGIDKKRQVSKKLKSYWYDGKAELSSYKLIQSRYGETHEGTAVMVYVTEPFSKEANTKADNPTKNDVPVLKLNTTRKFTTGIYPYSMMSTTFFPFENGNASLKMASSVQEWCGMTYFEMKNEDQFVFNFDSYFEGFSFKDKKVNKVVLEDDLFSLIRLNPKTLPVGELEIIPSMFFLRLRNKEVKPHKALVQLTELSNGLRQYEINYPDLERELKIQFKAAFPYTITGWEDKRNNGYGDRKTITTTKAELLKTVKTDYWNQNLNQDKHWRTKLKLD